MSEFKSSPQTLFLEYKKVQIKISQHVDTSSSKLSNIVLTKSKKQTNKQIKKACLDKNGICPITSI